MNNESSNCRDASAGPERTSRGEGFSLRRLKTFESFKSPVFCIYYGAMIGYWFGWSIQTMTRSLLVYRITGSGAVIGVLALAQAIPTLVMALFGGAISDRIQKKHILLIGQMASAFLSLAIALSLTFRYLSAEIPGSWWLLIVAAAFQGAVSGFMNPSRMAIIPEIVSIGRVTNAIALAQMGMTIFRLIGPAVAGFLIDVYDFASIYYLMTGLYVVATIFAFFLPRTGVKTAPNKIKPLADVLAGLRYIRGDATILLIVIFGVCHMISGMPYQQLLPIFTEDILKAGASGLGILASVSGVGALLGSLVLASLPNRKRGILLILSGLIMGLALMVFSWSRWWYLSLTIIPFVGLGPSMHGTLTASLVQYYVAPDYRGRMQSFVMMGSGLASMGIFFAGILSDLVGVGWSVGGMALFLTFVSIAYLIFARRITKLE